MSLRTSDSVEGMRSWAVVYKHIAKKPETFFQPIEKAQVGFIGEGRFVRGSARSAVPVAVPGIFLGAKAPCQLPTAATRSIPFIRHRRRSCRSPYAGFFAYFLAGARK